EEKPSCLHPGHKINSAAMAVGDVVNDGRERCPVRHGRCDVSEGHTGCREIGHCPDMSADLRFDAELRADVRTHLRLRRLGWADCPWCEPAVSPPTVMVSASSPAST